MVLGEVFERFLNFIVVVFFQFLVVVVIFNSNQNCIIHIKYLVYQNFSSFPCGLLQPCSIFTTIISFLLGRECFSQSTSQFQVFQITVQNVRYKQYLPTITMCLRVEYTFLIGTILKFENNQISQVYRHRIASLKNILRVSISVVFENKLINICQTRSLQVC